MRLKDLREKGDKKPSWNILDGDEKEGLQIVIFKDGSFDLWLGNTCYHITKKKFEKLNKLYKKIYK